MKYFYSLLIICLLSACRDKKSEEFEGVIKYAIRLETSNPELSREDMQQIYGDTANCYYKAGNFRSSYNGMNLREAYYISKENREYAVIAGIDSLLQVDCTIPLDTLRNFSGPEEAETINGYPCKKISIQTDNYTRTYWYNEDFYLDPDYFKNYNLYHISRYYATAKAPYLKYSYEGPGFSITYTMVSIERKAVPESTFALPDMPRKEWKR